MVDSETKWVRFTEQISAVPEGLRRYGTGSIFTSLQPENERAENRAFLDLREE
ncbi:MAG: hypothetical protein IJF17_10340 [Thermoguttaceae bacterium]|nr:hypothetical protein [Thermoguttaceae bacterium]